jgi:Zn-dependent protease
VESPQLQAQSCTGCGTKLASTLKSCPGCGALVHRARLTALHAQALEHEQQGAVAEALWALRSALELLPAGSKQHVALASRVRALSSQVDRGEAPKAGAGSAPRWLAGLGAAGLLLWKFKWLLAVVLGKAKFLLLGLTKLKTLLTMLLSLGAYWTLWGWKFALGAVLSLYAHEMGHVAALSRYGVRASAPMFVPGLGALVRLEQHLASPSEEARVGIAGPLWGLAASAACYAVYGLLNEPLFAALAAFGAWVNLFNLVPVWQLDGSRVFAALSRPARASCALLALLSALWVDDVLLYAIAVVAGLRAWNAPAQASDKASLARYVFCIVALSALLLLTRSAAPTPG